MFTRRYPQKLMITDRNNASQLDNSKLFSEARVRNTTYSYIKAPRGFQNSSAVSRVVYFNAWDIGKYILSSLRTKIKSLLSWSNRCGNDRWRSPEFGSPINGECAPFIHGFLHLFVTIPGSPGGEVGELVGCYYLVRSSGRAVPSKLDHPWHSQDAPDCGLGKLCVGFPLVRVDVIFTDIEHHSIFLLLPEFSSHGRRISTYSFKALSRFIFSFYWKAFKIFWEVR